MRYLILIALFCLCYYILKKILFPTQRTYKTFKRNHKSSTDKELVQDPHCHTYIAKETALRTAIGGEVFYFCSQKCLEEYRKAYEVQDG